MTPLLARYYAVDPAVMLAVLGIAGTVLALAFGGLLWFIFRGRH